MGRKSNRKKAVQAWQPAMEAEQHQLVQRTLLILFSGAVFLVWGILLFNRTFISTQAQFFIILLGSTIGIIVLRFLWRHKKRGLTTTLCYGIFVGASFPYGFLAISNYYTGYNKTQKVQLDILESGNHSKRKSGCRTPYVVVEFDNMNKEIKFDCNYEESISQYKSVTLTIAKGLWGFTVIKNELLNK